MTERPDTHRKWIGYGLWIFGFTGSHRFYYGKRKTGLLWLCTFGLLGVGWLIDLFLIPGMERQAERRFVAGRISYNLAWILLTFGGPLGLHRFYMGKVLTGLIWLGAAALTAATGGLAGPLTFVLHAYDLWTLNQQVDEINGGA